MVSPRPGPRSHPSDNVKRPGAVPRVTDVTMTPSPQRRSLDTMSNTEPFPVVDPATFLASTPVERRKWVLAMVEAHPDRHDQHYWVKRGPECGTTACLAGWACLLAGYTPTAHGGFNHIDPHNGPFIHHEQVIDEWGEQLSIQTAAARLLGLGDPGRYGSAANRLFLKMDNEVALDMLRDLASEGTTPDAA